MRAKLDTIFEGDFGDNGVFIKLNWKAPVDGRWLNHNLQCINSDEVFSLLKSSSIVSSQIQFLSTHSKEACLVVRKYYDFQPSMEFRVFVKNNQIIGIS